MQQVDLILSENKRGEYNLRLAEYLPLLFPRLCLYNLAIFCCKFALEVLQVIASRSISIMYPCKSGCLFVY